MEKRAEQMDQIVTLAAVNQSVSLVINPNLVTGMIEEAAKLMEETVNTNLPKFTLISDEDKIIDKGFERCDGPFVKALDSALASFNVERQAYYSGTFIGNHVHRCLQVCIVRTPHVQFHDS